MTRIDIRDPSLVVLVGAAGSGKSTFAARWFEPSEILSSDAFREILTGDPSDQRATKTAFSIIHREVTKRLAAKRTVVVDATNVEPSARRQLIARAQFANMPAIAIVFALPLDVVHARNAARHERVVDPAVVERQVARLETSLSRMPAEGFDAVTVLRSSGELDRADVVRTRTSERGASMPTLEPERLWRIGERFSEGLRVSLVDSIPDPGRAIRGALTTRTVRGEARDLGVVHDLVGTYYGVTFLIGPAFIAALREYGATGWEAIAVEIPGVPDELSLLVATGRVGPVLSASVTAPVGGFTFGRFLATDRWDGSDLFVPENENVILVTDGLATHLRRKRLSNLDLEPAGIEALPQRGR